MNETTRKDFPRLAAAAAATPTTDPEAGEASATDVLTAKGARLILQVSIR